MREVSCRVFSMFFQPLAQRGIPAYRMTEGTTVKLARLREKQERIDWSEMCVIMRNLGRVFSEDDLIEIGRTHFRAPSMRFVFVVGRLLFTPMEFYRWANKPNSGAGNQMFTCVQPTHREISATECELDLELPEGFEVSWEFMVVAAGNMIEMPRLLGYPPAKVTLTRIPRGGRFHIVVPARTSLTGKALRAVSWPFTVQAAARELKEAHETLRERFDQLQDAKTALERQRSLLDTAYRFGQRIWSERDPLTTAQAIVSALVATPSYAAATLEVAPADAPTALERAGAGVAEAKAERLTLGLSGRGHLVGQLEVDLRDGADAAEARTLLELLAPTIAITLDNAFAYRALADYQKDLEGRVERRTAELRAAHDSLAATVKALEDAHKARERIFANISHEIRTPLSLILLAVRDLESRGALDPTSQRGTRSIELSARKLLRLVDELLLLAAGETQSLRLKPEPIDASELLETLATTWRPGIESNEVELVTAIAPGCVALADAVAVERMLSNLLSNALKYTPRGGRITLSATRADEQIAIGVRDSGVGIDDELMSRLFGRFEQGQSADQVRGGSGIGLSLVKELAVAQGGDVTVERLQPSGTAFAITLPATHELPIVAGSPRLRPADYGHGAAPIANGALRAPADRAAPTILLAEDEPSLASWTAELLSEDYTVLVALDGAAALDLAVRHRPHLLVTDIDMPKMDGVELTRRFRALPGNGLAPVVMLSALADIKDRLTGLDAGAVDYVVKPFDPKELKARVRAQLEIRNLALRLHQAEKLASLGTLSAGLAHELRNPANGIVNAIGPLRELLPAELTSPDSGSGQLLEVLAGCAEQISSLSKQLLGFRRGGELELRTVPLGDVVQRAQSLVSPALRGIELRDKVDAATPIRCAPPLLVQVVTNLLENAAHAAGQGGWVGIDSRTIDGRVVVEVSDSGPGVPRELRERIFEPFFTTKAPGVGTGLGLAVARDIVSRHGGTLEVREHGGRAAFVIDLPRLE